MRIMIFWVGKTRAPAISSLAAEYLARIRHLTACGIVEVPDMAKRRSLRSAELLSAEGEEIAKRLPEIATLVALDEKGRQFSSASFSSWLESEMSRGTKEIAFVIGGPAGLSSTILKRANMKLSLGLMTWTHEMCRVLLLEQIYRALAIIRNLPYHK